MMAVVESDFVLVCRYVVNENAAQTCGVEDKKAREEVKEGKK
jgi:hypothetical protein